MATFEELADSVIPTSRSDQDTIQRKILLRGSMIFIEEHIGLHHRELAVIEWTSKSWSCTWWKMPVSDNVGISNGGRFI
jgi:hypothetical protein